MADRDIEQAADAATPPDPVFQAVREAITAKVGLFDLDGAKIVSIDELARAVVEAAVPATAECIAALSAALDALAHDFDPSPPNGPLFCACCTQMAVTKVHQTSATVLAGLSAGATTGEDSDE